VLTHHNRATYGGGADSAYGDEGGTGRLAVPAALRRPYSVSGGQPIALVVAEESEIARFAASLVRMEYTKAAHVTDVHRERE